MSKILSPCQMTERIIITKFRKVLWKPFINAVNQYQLLSPGDVIAVPQDGSAASILCAKLLQELGRHSDIPFSLVFPITKNADRDVLATTARLLEIPLVSESTSCTGIALPDLQTDLIENLLGGMLYDGRLACFLPKEVRPDTKYIRPLYCVRRDDIEAWVRYNQLTLSKPQVPTPKQDLLDRLMDEMRLKNPNVEKNIVTGIHAVSVDTFPGCEKQ